MSAVDVVVIDYGIGNMLSVQRGFEHCGATVSITSDHEEILKAPRVVLPGVGAFGNAMEALHNQGLVAVIHRVADQNTPLLGICLGMQMLLDESDEFGSTKGLGVIPGHVISISENTTEGDTHKIPHIGWNALLPAKKAQDWDGTVMQNITPGESVYFVHSHMAVPDDASDRIAHCLYGGHEIAATIGRGNITGCQFHPEKSGDVGLKILRSFLVA